jgi:hypothetical protein
MRTFTYGTCIVLICTAARVADGHGTPILVGQSGGVLTAGGGLADGVGFAPQVFVEDDEDGDPLPPATLPNVGPVLLWQIPGYNISGLNDSASISIEVLARPVKDTNPIEERILWYWNPLTQEVEPAEADFYLLGTGMRYTTLSPDETTPPPFLMASTLTGQQNFHNHGLLSYALDNDSTPADGAYGFFARLISNQYSPSDAFLIVVNNGVAYEQMVTAALAINAAAAEPEMLPGDFNHDGVVDSADYVMWRKASGIGDDYAIWVENFGRSFGAGSIELNVPFVDVANVPEPVALQLMVALSVALYAAVTFRCRLTKRDSRR